MIQRMQRNMWDVGILLAIVSCAVVVFGEPTLAYSPEGTGYALLEPSILVQGGGKSASPADYLENIFYFMIGTAGVLAVLVFAIGGIQFMVSGATPSAKKEGQEKMTAAIFGLILALGTWLILNTINPDLVKKFDLKLDTVTVTGSGGTGSTYDGKLNEITITREDGTTYTFRGIQDAYQSSPGLQLVGEDGKYLPEKITKEEAMRYTLMKDSDIVITSTTGSSKPCTYPGQTGCTDLYGMKAATIEEIKYIDEKTKGQVLVTGGTEHGPHAIGAYSHGSGHKVDIDDTSNVTDYVENNFIRRKDLDREGTHASRAYENPDTEAIWHHEYKKKTHFDVVVYPERP